MGIVEQSKNAGAVLRTSAVLNFRVRMAMEQLRQDVRMELWRLSADASDAAISKIIEGLPEDALYRELAART